MRHNDLTGTTTLEQPLRVGEVGDQSVSTCRGIDDTTHLHHAARLVVDRAIGELKLHRRHLFQHACHAAGGLRHTEDVGLTHGEEHLHGADVRYRCQRAGSGDEGTFLEWKISYHSCRRRTNDAPRQRLLGCGKRCLSLRHLSAGGSVAVLCRLELILTDDVLVEELLIIKICETRRVGLGTGGVQSGTTLVDLRTVSLAVDGEHRLARAHGLAFMHIDIRDKTGNFGVDIHILKTFDGCRIGSLQVGARSTYRTHGKLIVLKVGQAASALLTSARGKS